MNAPAAARKTTYREAIKQAIREALNGDPRVFLMGEDVGRYGGCYAVTKGLLQEFGEERIRDTPLSESAFVGAGIGAAMAGMRPIVEIMTVNFSLLALDQIVNNAATIPHMSGGQFAVPLVIRMATGAGRQLAAQHSHSLEGWYAHIPGLKIVAPATLEDARGMLGSALAGSQSRAHLRARQPVQHGRRAGAGGGPGCPDRRGHAAAGTRSQHRHLRRQPAQMPGRRRAARGRGRGGRGDRPAQPAAARRRRRSWLRWRARTAP